MAAGEVSLVALVTEAQAFRGLYSAWGLAPAEGAMRSKLHLPASTLLLIIIMSCCMNANSQDYYDSYIVRPNQEVQIASLPSVVAASKSKSDVMVSSVATAVIDPDVCCGRNSALVDRVDSANGRSLMLLGEKLRGKHYMDSGLSIVVTDQYWPGASVNADDIVASLMARRPLLMDWSGRLYVLYGAVFDEYIYTSGKDVRVIHTLMLVDTRFSDRRRYVSFNRQTDDWGKVTGLLALAITRDK